MVQDLLSEKVVLLLPEFEPKPTQLWLIYPSRQSITPAVRLLTDMLKINCRDILSQLITKGVLQDAIID